MKFLEAVLRFLDTQAKNVPVAFGAFHLFCMALMVLSTVYLCLRRRKDDPRKAVLLTAIVVAVLEIYKQINFTFQVRDTGIVADFQWYSFPWQFCSMPMYAGLLTGIFRKGKIHDALCAFLASYAIFAGLCVMLYPVQVFTGTIGINIQTMICHGTMIPIGAYLLATGHVKLEHKTILKALPVFACAVLAAIVMNEIAFYSGLLEHETFNMLFISRHCEPSLPVYSLVQQVVPYPWCLIIYISAFTLAAYLMLLAAMAIRSLSRKKTTV